MRAYKDQVFRGLVDRDSVAVVEDIRLEQCTFTGCALSLATEPARRTTVRRIEAMSCFLAACEIQTAVIEDVIVDGLRSNDLVTTHGAVFGRVTLRGNLGRILLSPVVDAAELDSERQRAFAEANAAYYRQVDWALDISEARFSEATIRSVPARLIRRDPRTQVVVTRERAASGDWRRLDLNGTYWPTAIEGMLERGDLDVVLVAPKLAPNFARLREGLELLRAAGVAEPE